MAGAPGPVCVLGAGPAGCIVAYRLAMLGHEVVLLVRSRAHRHPMGETAPLSVIRLLEGIALGDSVAMATYRVATEGLALWDSEAPTAHRSPTLLLRRDRFDAVLRIAAESAGVRVFQFNANGASRRKVGGGWRLPFVTAAGEGYVEASFLVDARGRRGGARRLSAATIALAGCWHDAAPLPAATCLEATSDAWAWGGVAPDGRQAAACFVDPGRIARVDAAGRMALYAELLAHAVAAVATEGPDFRAAGSAGCYSVARRAYRGA